MALDHPSVIGVTCASPDDSAYAASLAERLDLPILGADERSYRHHEGSLLLRVADGRAGLQLLGPAAPGPVVIDFRSPAMQHRRRGGQNELLGRALGWKAERAPRVIDATAGLGRDAYVLADLGCDVLLCERHPVLAALLEDAATSLLRSGNERMVANGQRLRIFTGDARQLPGHEFEACDAIYLDPMFPVRRKALPGKELQVLQVLMATAPVDDPLGESLLPWALKAPVARVVVKRPRLAPALPGPEPGHRISGKAVRFDVYPVAI